MHNIDRTNLESNYGESNEYEYETAGNHEYETDNEYNQESPFNEAEEMELAAELLGVSSEAELDQFLGKIIKDAGRAVGGAIKGPVGKALGGALKGIAKQALPAVGGLVGNVMLPGIGGAVGSKLISTAGKALGLELEGLSYEDQEFEVAKGVVRLAGAAAGNAAMAAPSSPPRQVAQTALTEAAKTHAPGLLRGAHPQTGAEQKCQHPTSGRWVRRGNTIILEGA
jgi:uncharacterized protein (DUF697 family)